MSNTPKKRSGIGGFWDTVAPPAEELQPAPAAPAEQPTSSTPPKEVDVTIPAAATGAEAQSRDVAAASTPRPRGRPPSSVPKERMTVNLSSRSLQILESLRYQERMRGRRNATFSDLLDEAVELLARHYQLPEAE